MGIDEVCGMVGLKRITLLGDAVPVGLSKLVEDVETGGIEVHEVTGTINSVPVRCIVWRVEKYPCIDT